MISPEERAALGTEPATAAASRRPSFRRPPALGQAWIEQRPADYVVLAAMVLSVSAPPHRTLSPPGNYDGRPVFDFAAAEEPPSPPGQTTVSTWAVHRLVRGKIDTQTGRAATGAA